MEKVEMLKKNIEYYLGSNLTYDVLEKRIMDNPIRKGLITFNIIFADQERSLRYSASGFENEEGDCCFMLEAFIYTGIKYDTEENKNIRDFDLNIKNNGKGKEAIIKLTKWFEKEMDFDFGEAMDIIIEDGIQKLIY